MIIYTHLLLLSRVVPVLLLLCIFNAQAVAAVSANITANGSNAPLSLKDYEAISIDINLDQGDEGGVDADWWVLAKTPFGWYHYELSGGWKPGLLVTYQGPIKILSNYQVLSNSLPPGDYTFYFGVDTVRNGQPDMDSIYYDTVDVTFISTQNIDPIIGTWDFSNDITVSITNLTETVGDFNYYSGTVDWNNGSLMISGSPYTQNRIKLHKYQLASDKYLYNLRITINSSESFDSNAKIQFIATQASEEDYIKGEIPGLMTFLNETNGVILESYYNAPGILIRR